jgi:16S rRNA (guanine(966)-N(2))-methyltransferase RsmD
VRVIGGKLRGKQIQPGKQFKARPTTDFAKENLFNILHHLVALDGARVLDLFSGTGAISYEFASRGAATVIAVENDYHHYTFIKHTAANLGLDRLKVYKNDAFLACAKLRDTPFDIIFADPPYNHPRVADIPAALFDNNLLAPAGIAVIEHPATVNFATDPRFTSRRQYGSVNFSFFQPANGKIPSP